MHRSESTCVRTFNEGILFSLKCNLQYNSKHKYHLIGNMYTHARTERERERERERESAEKIWSKIS